MATVNKDFRIKAGLVVEGANATVDGEDIITTGSTTDVLPEGTTNLYFTAERAADAVADEISTAVSTAVDALDTDAIEEGETNLYFTNQRALDATSSAYDAAGAASSAQSAAQSYADGLASNYDAAGAASTVQDNLDDHTGASSNVHGVTGSVVGTTDTQDLSNKRIIDELTFSDGLTINNEAQIAVLPTSHDFEIKALEGDVVIVSNNGDVILDADGSSYLGSATAGNEIATKGYVDGLASNYDAAGAAATAEGAANEYTDTALESYTPTSSLDSTVSGYGYLKSADLSGYATESYVGTAIDNLVDGAPGLLDTLNEIAAAIADDENYATTMTTALAGKQDELTAGNGIDITGDTISVAFDAGNGLAINGTNLTVDTNVIATKTYAEGVADDADTSARGYADSLASNYDAAGAAATAEQNAKDYADETFVAASDLPGQLDDYIPLTQKGTADGVATLDGSGFVPSSQLNIDVSGDISTAIDALTTDDIEEGEENLYFTDERAIDAVSAADIYPNAVIVNNVSKTVANAVTASTASTVSGLTWAKADYRSAKLVVKAETATHSQVSEIMVTLDASDNVAITEFGVVYTDAELATVTADVSGTDVRIRVTTLNASTNVMVVGTLLI